jgi:GTP-binding protein HflX
LFDSDQTNIQSVQQERALLAGIYGFDDSRIEARMNLDELERLTETAGGKVIEKKLQRRTAPDPATYIGEGKLRDIHRSILSNDIEVLIFDDDLSASQVHAIEQKTETKVLDRSGLILDIFASQARTSAAKTQVELAQLEYLRPRLTRFWSHLSRQQGGIGTRGPGESQIETDRRLIDKRISSLKEKLNTLEKQRKTQRKSRSNIICMSLVGYTNAGKSTLMNVLTEADVEAQDRLFATLDSTVRRMSIANHQLLLSDTVGFIRKLPHALVESFKSTLDEVREADILLHVIDSTSKRFREDIEVVEDMLAELNADGKKVLKVFNKIDLLSPNQITDMQKSYPKAAFISAERGIGLKGLKECCRKLIEKDYIHKTIQIPLAKYEAVAFLHRTAHIYSKEYVDSQIKVSFDISRKNFLHFQNMLSTLEEQAVAE